MGTIAVGTVLLFIIALAARKVYYDRKRGCGCSCGARAGHGCPGCGQDNDRSQ